MSTCRDPVMESAIDSESVTRAKTAIRKTITRQRKALGDTKRNKKSLTIVQRLFGLDEFKESKAVLCFLSLSHEVQIDAVIWESLRLGKEVFVPTVDIKKRGLQVVRIPSLDIDFVLGKYGVREPAPGVGEMVSPSCIDFVIAPGLAFDVCGNRLGYGGGYYDKLLKKMSPEATRVGIAYDFQILDLVPHSDLDEPVQFLVTEIKTLKCRSI